MKIFKEIMSYVVIILIVVLIRCFVVTPVKVDGSSMNPTLNDKEVLILKKYDKSIERFDIVVVDYGNTKLVKRVIALPNETIKIMSKNTGYNHYVSSIYINGNKLDESYGNEPIKDPGLANTDYKLGDDEYFVMGDNRNNSSDSRIIGAVKSKDIAGVTNLRVFPFTKIGKLD
ncbi:MAG: signal peptidase I [Bacilli bacterium]|nr:signal peptidase I [Bacilli bacterium]